MAFAAKIVINIGFVKKKINHFPKSGGTSKKRYIILCIYYENVRGTLHGCGAFFL